MSSNLEQFFEMPHRERMPIILEAIEEKHKYHFNNNRAYRKAVSARGLSKHVDITSYERMLRSASLTYKSYIEHAGFFPQDHPLIFVKWLNEQLSVPLPEERFTFLKDKYKTFDAMLVDIENVYSDQGIEIVTSSGTSGKTSVVARDKETITLSFKSFFTCIDKSWGVKRGTSLIFVMPNQTRVAMARTATLGVRELSWSSDASVYFTMPFTATTDIIRIRSGRIFREGLTGVIEKRILNPLIAWGSEKKAKPVFTKNTWEALQACIEAKEPLMLLGAANQLHLFTGGKTILPTGSRIATGGGMKELYPYTFDQIRDDLKKSFANTPISDVYGMSEANWAAFECSEGNYHIPPWVYPVITDNNDRIIQEQEGKGLLAFFDPIGGGNLLPPFFQTADHVCLINGGCTYNSDLICSCGYDTAYIRGRVMRADLLGEAGCAGQI